MAKKRSPLHGLTVVIKNAPHQQAVRLRKGTGRNAGMAWLERLVFDPGLNKWVVIDKTPRPDLAHVEEFKMPLIGDESNAEIEENIGLATDNATDKWFKNKERPNWDAIQALLRDRDEARLNRARGRTQFYIPGRDF